MLVLPIRTESESRRTPIANYGLIGVNLLAFIVLQERVLGDAAQVVRDQYLAFQSEAPEIYQFFTYQFVHAGPMHVLGNMLFLWVFGNSVNGKMGQLPYLMFYLAGGAFAAWGFALAGSEASSLVGASGAVAAITTAYLALFPRSRVTVLAWFFFIYFFEVSAMLVIGLKIIVWDNIVAPQLVGAGNVAYAAHLSGYLFGFVGAMALLLMRALPRDQFDMLALWKRWNQRRQFAASMAQPGAEARGRYGSAARTDTVDKEQRTREDERLDEMATLRTKIGEAIDRGDKHVAAEFYEELTRVDPKQCLSERWQLDVARELYTAERFESAALAFERFVACYPNSVEAENVRFLLGIIYARDLKRFEAADEYLTKTWETMRDRERREQCYRWLADVRAALDRPVPDPNPGG